MHDCNDNNHSSILPKKKRKEEIEAEIKDREKALSQK
jgi:hypothetical protein